MNLLLIFKLLCKYSYHFSSCAFFLSHIWTTFESFCLYRPTNLLHYQSRIEEFAEDRSSTMHSFTSFIAQGLSARESLTIHSLKRELKYHLSSLSHIMLNSYEDGWRHFGRYNKSANEFVFFPSIYVQTLQCQLEFQAMFAHTQLFVGYLEEEKESSQLDNCPNKISASMFIADWIYFRWHMFLKTSKTDEDTAEKDTDSLNPVASHNLINPVQYLGHNLFENMKEHMKEEVVRNYDI